MFCWRVIRPTLAAVPARRGVMAAKVAVVTAAALAITSVHRRDQ